MTVVTRSPGACGAGPWNFFTPENLAVGGVQPAEAYLDTTADRVQSASAFGFAIPADATITSLTVEGLYATSNVGWIALRPSVGVSASDQSLTEVGWTVIQGVTDTAWALPTVAQLNSSDFAVTATASRPSGAPSWVYLDYITLTVEYDEFVPGPATVVTTAVTSITPNWASSGGTVTAEGGSAVSERGIIWGAGDVTLETADGGIAAGGGMGNYVCVAEPLLEQKGYMLRAYAVNSYGVAYGNNIYFETPRGRPTVTTSAVTAITPTSASSGGTVTLEGLAAVTARGIIWGAGDVTLETADGVAVDPGAQGGYVCVAEPLLQNKGYMLRAYAVNSYGVAYGDAIYFETPWGVPTVQTGLLDVSYATATGVGDVTSAGLAPVTDRGICLSTSPNPRVGNYSAGGGTGVFYCYLTGLTPGTRYYVAAFAGNGYGYNYGADVTFVTHAVPAIATAGAYDIDATTATSGGNVTSGHGEAVTSRGVCWSVEENPTTAANLIPVMTSATAPSGVASSSADFDSAFAKWRAFDHLTNAWASPAGGIPGWIGYQFPTAHVVTRYAITNRIGGVPEANTSPKTWTFKGSNDGATWVTLDTQTNVTDWATTPGVRKVFDFANTVAYAYYRLDVTAVNGSTVIGVGELEMMEAADEDTIDGSGLGAFVSYLTGLTEGATYNVRAYATNVAGTAYGAAVVFTATADAPPVEPPPGPPRDPSENLLFDGTLELKVGTLDVAGSATQVKYSNSNPGGFGNLSFRLPADAPYAAFDAQVVKDAAVTLKHGLMGFVATLFEGEVTSDVSHATIEGGKAYYDVTCAGLWWAAEQRKDFSMVIGDDDYGQWYARDDNAKAFQVSTDGCLEIRLEAGQSAAAGDSASLYYWLGKGMGDPAASIDSLFGLLGLNVNGANWLAQVWSAPTPWGPWTACIGWTNGGATDLALCVPTLGDNPQALKLELSTTSAVDALPADRFVRLDKVSVGSGVSANGLSAVSAANPTVVTSTSAHGLRSGDRVFITQSSASTPTISGWRTVTVTNATHFTVPVAVTTAGGAGTFYKATRIDQALVEIAVTTGLATLASLQPGGIGNLNWGLNVRPHASRAGGIDLLAATNVAPFDYGFWDNKTFYCQDRPLAIRALHDYLIDSSLPGIDFDVRRATEDSPTTVKVLYKFRAEDGETSPYPDGTALAVYRTAAGYGGPAASANLIPAMTSNTAPSGVVTESGHLATYAAWMAFDHTNPAGATSGTWVPPAGTTGWFGYQFPAAHVVTQYAVTTRNLAAPNVQAPKTWTFKGSNDGATWTTLDTQTNVTDWATTSNVRKVFSFANTTAYAYYRLDITASNDAAYVGVGELEMMETVYTAPPAWADASPVLDVWDEWADLSLTTAQAGDLCDQILAWLSANAYQGGGTIAPATVPLRAEGTKPAAYIRAGDCIEDSQYPTGPLMITGFSMDADRGVGSIAIGENRRAFVERLTPDKA